jgi:hypothetical protein
MDAAVLLIADETGEAKSYGFALRLPTVKHALDATGDDQGDATAIFHANPCICFGFARAPAAGAFRNLFVF